MALPNHIPQTPRANSVVVVHSLFHPPRLVLLLLSHSSPWCTLRYRSVKGGVLQRLPSGFPLFSARGFLVPKLRFDLPPPPPRWRCGVGEKSFLNEFEAREIKISAIAIFGNREKSRRFCRASREGAAGGGVVRLWR